MTHHPTQMLKNIMRDALHHDPQKTQYEDLFHYLQPDAHYEGELLLGLWRAPAATRYHHTQESGLAVHLVEMWDIWHGISQDLGFAIPDHRHFCDQEVFKAIFHHDLHKAWRTFRLVPPNRHLGEPDTLWKVVYSKGRTQQVFSNLTKTLWLLQHFGIRLDQEQYHTLISSEGGWAEIKTRRTTQFAKFIYLLDEWSSNVSSPADPVLL